MGKPFLSELRQLEVTYNTALSLDVTPLKSAISESLRYPLIAIGSGGSLSAAKFVCHLHQLASGQLARPATPMEVVSMLEETGSRRSIINSAVICLTAGGANTDIRRAWKFLIDAEPRHLTALCARTNSPLAQVGEKYSYTRIFDFDLPSKKDGFLATNSLLAFLVIICRVFSPFIDIKPSLPPSIWHFLPNSNGMNDALEDLRKSCYHTLERDYLTVLYSEGLAAAACDFESKFTEAALSAIQMSDFRNFAHGRHHWLAKHENKSGVIAFTTDRDYAIAKKTISTIPANVPSVIFRFPGNTVTGVIGAVLTGFLLTKIAGEIRGIDPGKPGVPEFGRRLYHLGFGARKKTSSGDKASLRRKSYVCSASTHLLHEAHNAFCHSLNTATFTGLVLDYDGTLCGPENRFDALDSNIVQEIVRLLQAGVPLGIATGRGKSVRKSLQEALPMALWNQITVGYYNGAECGSLSNNNAPDGAPYPCKELDNIAKALCTDESIRSISNVTVRNSQISIEPINTSYIDFLWGLVGSHLSRNPCIRMLQSSHSIDILAPGVTKRNVITIMKSSCNFGQTPEILCIGDQGCWPGNDTDLLSERYSLSVDNVSPDLSTCWNLAPPGFRGQQATLHYLKLMVASQGVFRFNIE